MYKLLRRLFGLALLGGAGFAGFSAWQQRREPAPTAPQWPPFDPAAKRSGTVNFASTATASAATTPAASVAKPSAPESTAEQRWVAPIDGQCPAGFPVKANDNSGIYHVPGGRSYARTVAERCYTSAEAAEADGYRAAKA